MKPLFLAAVLAVSAGLTHADDYDAVMADYARTHIMSWLSDSRIVNAVRTQNLRHAALSEEEINERDRQWRLQVGQADRPLVDPVLKSTAADFLRTRVAQSEGVITEVFVMDNRGLNVAASDATSDYWQGDEAKFIDTFGSGTQEVHISDIELDESTQTYQGQVSVAIADPETGELIGAVTVGLNAELLF